MRRLIRFVFVVALVLGGLVAVLSRVPVVQDAVVRRMIARNLSQTQEALFQDDALRVLLCGTSSPMPHPTRARPCVAVIAGGKFYIVDTGTGSWNNLALWHIPGERIGAVLLTHFHSDHIAELGEFNMQTWVAGRPGPLPVYGPLGVERVVSGFAEAYALDSGYRTAHHGADFLPLEKGRMQATPITFGGAESTRIFEAGDLKVTAFLVNHAPIEPAVGYRFDYRGRSVVVSGDTVKSAGLIHAANGADVLLHEAQANDIVAMIGAAAKGVGRDRIAKLMGDIQNYHSTPVEAAQAANEAGVHTLVLYHLTPPPPNRLAESVFLRGVEAVRKDVILAHDGLVIELPLGSKEVRTSTLH